MARHAAVLAERRLFVDVRTALLHGGPPPGEGLAGLQGRTVYVMPVMMCAGRHVMRTLPAALGGTERAGGAGPTLHFCRPLGLHPAIAGLVAARASGELARQRWSPEQTNLLLAAHGSKTDPASRQAADLQATWLRARRLFGSVATAFLEEEPSLPAALAALPGPLIVAGLFAAPGAHAGHDVTRMLADCRRRDVAYLGAIGADAAIPEIIVKIVQAGAPGTLRR